MWVVGLGGQGCVTSAVAPEPLQTEEQFLQLVGAYPEADLRLGRRIFLKQCSVCHQASGAGASKAIPPLRGHLPTLAAHPEGRGYLARLVLFGLNGPITVNGQKYYNAMPALGALLSDEELAAAVNYAQVSWGNDRRTSVQQLVRAEDIKAARGVYQPAAQTLKRRNALWPEGVMAPLATPQASEGPGAPKAPGAP